MPLRTETLYLNIGDRSDTRLATSLEDPTRIDPGPLWIAGDKFPLVLYVAIIRGATVEPINLPTGYTCTLSAVRYDQQNETQLFSAELERETKQNGHLSFAGTLDLTSSDLTANLAIDDEQNTIGIRARCQAKIESDDSSEIHRFNFLVILRDNIDPAA